MCSKNAILIVQTKRISTFLTIFQITGFLPFLHFLLEQQRDTCTILIFYVILLTHYTVNNILYHGTKLKPGRQISIDTWLICYAIEFTGLFVFSVYSSYFALAWPARGWPKYYRKNPLIISTISSIVVVIHVVCWVFVLKCYISIDNQHKHPIEIISVVTSDNRKENNTDIQHNNHENFNLGVNIEKDDWSNDVIMEIGRKIWNDKNME